MCLLLTHPYIPKKKEHGNTFRVQNAQLTGRITCFRVDDVNGLWLSDSTLNSNFDLVSQVTQLDLPPKKKHWSGTSWRKVTMANGESRLGISMLFVSTFADMRSRDPHKSRGAMLFGATQNGFPFSGDVKTKTSVWPVLIWPMWPTSSYWCVEEVKQTKIQIQNKESNENHHFGGKILRLKKIPNE